VSPEEAARGDIPEQNVTVLGVRIDDDRATVWMLTNDRAPYHEDLLRAAIVFTGAKLDATLKQLIRDALPLLLERSKQSHDKFETFAGERLGTGLARAHALSAQLCRSLAEARHAPLGLGRRWARSS
jgi:hypothetical protein